MTSSRASLVEKILGLKKERNAVLLVHNYQRPEIQDIADYLGDSLGLSQQAAKTDADVIVFCGVHFMAETAAMICPDKIVLLPEPRAGCPMADMITPDKLEDLKAEYPGAAVVTYINSTAETKALSDYCCTSANAAKVVRAVPEEEIIFVPDKWLGQWVARQVSEKTIHLYPGYCPTHQRILPQDLKRQKEAHPQALVVAHPECGQEIVAMADAVESTSGMTRFCRESPATEFIIATENGIIHRLEKENPGKRFYAVTALAICPNMKKTTLEKIAVALEDLQPRITVPPETAEKAMRSIRRMLEIV